MDELEDSQQELQKEITKLFANIKKCPLDRRSQPFYQTRLEQMDKFWKRFDSNNQELLSYTKQERQSSKYFKQEMYSECLEHYLEAKTHIQEKLQEIIGPQSVPASGQCIQTKQEVESTFSTKLSPIPLPTFSGNYNDWLSFKDIFTSMVHNSAMAKVHKCFYLKSCLRGEAELLLRQYPVTDTNYDIIWKLLNKRYDNKRSIVNTYLSKLLNQRKITSLTSKGIRELLDCTTECLETLHSLDLPTEQWGDIVVHIVISKLDTESHQLFEEKHDSDELPTWQEVSKFLEARFRTLEVVKKPTSIQAKAFLTTNVEQDTFSTTPTMVCVFCKENHFIFMCKEFSKLTVHNRREFAEQNNLCYNCLRPGHSFIRCIQSTCKKCGRKHHTLLHINRNSDSNKTTEINQINTIVPEITGEDQKQDETIEVTSHTVNGFVQRSPVLLPTAMVLINHNGTIHQLRTLIDQGSQASLITESACQAIGLTKERLVGQILGVNSNAIQTKASVTFNITSRVDPNYNLPVTAFVLPKLTSSIPAQEHSIDWTLLKTLKLADPIWFNKPSHIDLILGAEVYAQILVNGMHKNDDGTLMVQNSHLGWFVSGFQKGDKIMCNTITSCHAKIELDTILRQFWEIEEGDAQKRMMTNSEVECENHFETTHTRNEEGRYIVSLPFTTAPPDIGESRSIALKRLYSVERRLSKQPEVRAKYNEFMTDYIEQHHMVTIPPDTDDISNQCYFPHHAVINEQHLTTKLRVVFNASEPTSNGKSLNDNLHVGPPLQSDIRDIIVKWRKHRFVVVGDIRQMYRQIAVDIHDSNYQRIVWRFDTTEPVKDFSLQTVTYGTACAPYLAIRTMKQLANDEIDNFPIEIIESLKNDFFVDDYLSGDSTVEGAMKLKTNMKDLLQRGGFQLHKWTSNIENLQEQPEEVRLILGLPWHTQQDEFILKVSLPVDVNCNSKRAVLSDIAKIYDPHGWLSPVVITAKIMMQRLWTMKVEWDDNLPSDILQEWVNFKSELVSMPDIHLNRWLGCTTQHQGNMELHVFSDASMLAYAAVVYCRCIIDDQITVTMIEAKSRVAPLKQISLPRLELCGAVLAAKLLHHARTCLNIPPEQTYAWTDSSIVLAWLKRDPNVWSIFVANRVTTIINHVDKNHWFHVVSQENPADINSRGVSPSCLPNCELWWQGPYWLHSQKPLPTHVSVDSSDSTNVECKLSMHNVVVQNTYSIFDKFSSFSKLIRVIAYCKRFVEQCKLKIKKNTNVVLPNYLTAKELKYSLMDCVRLSQKTYFEQEINLLNKGITLNSKSKILKLSPYIDTDNVLRVGGRLNNCDLPEDVKHPIILHKNCNLSYLIVQYTHLKTLHGGVQLMLNCIADKYWIIGVKTLVKKCIRQCISCCRHAAIPMTQLMGQLPSSRLTPNKAFNITGVDFAGPVMLKLSQGRGCKIQKAYISLFICTCTKAVHLELVTSLDTEGFIAAFRRFVARRGHCKEMWSDRGTNFIGANKELKLLHKTSLLSIPDYLAEQLALEGVEWRFNPAGAPHMGGLWETAVKSTKNHLKRVIGDDKLTYEEYSTLLCQVEACLNSRPLTVINEPGEPSPLTPSHFLIGNIPNSAPDVNREDQKIPYNHRWAYIQQKVQSFWRRWSKEYLIQLQKRNKWFHKGNPIKLDAVVLVKDERLPPTKWALARVINVHPGLDGIIRVVSLKCKNSIIRRPIHKLVLLPTD